MLIQVHPELHLIVVSEVGWEFHSTREEITADNRCPGPAQRLYCTMVRCGCDPGSCDEVTPAHVYLWCTLLNMPLYCIIILYVTLV